MKTSEPIVFFGSGPVAANSLRLLAQDFNIEVVITKPRPPHHKGDVPLLELAQKLALPFYTVSTKKELAALFETKPLISKLGILIDFGIIVPREVIDYFPLGIINSHFSILPEWRGADPITFAILSGQPTTGVSLMYLVAAMDEGPLLAYREHSLTKGITAPELTRQLTTLSHSLLQREIPRVFTEKSKRSVPQSTTGRSVSYSRKLTKEDGIIDWQKPAVQLEREIRAFIDWPKSRVLLGGKEVIITDSYTTPSVPKKAKPGDISILREAGIIAVATTAGSLCIRRLKPIGKREMSTKEFLTGNKL